MAHKQAEAHPSNGKMKKLRPTWGQCMRALKINSRIPLWLGIANMIKQLLMKNYRRTLYEKIRNKLEKWAAAAAVFHRFDCYGWSVLSTTNPLPIMLLLMVLTDWAFEWWHRRVTLRTLAPPWIIMAVVGLLLLVNIFRLVKGR